jgi:hypothetical protein
VVSGDLGAERRLGARLSEERVVGLVLHLTAARPFARLTPYGPSEEHFLRLTQMIDRLPRSEDIHRLVAPSAGEDRQLRVQNGPSCPSRSLTSGLSAGAVKDAASAGRPAMDGKRSTSCSPSNQVVTRAGGRGHIALVDARLVDAQPPPGQGRLSNPLGRVRTETSVHTAAGKVSARVTRPAVRAARHAHVLVAAVG